jgi:DNA-binding CsgD family transcriptional regulator
MPRKKAAAKSSSTSTAKPQSKTAFVLSQPAGLSAKEVSMKAKAAGLAITEAYVYTIRSSAKNKAGMPRRKPGRPKGSKNAPKGGGRVAGAVSSLKKAEAQVLEWILEHGTPAVQQMVSNVTDRVRKIAG